MHIILLVFVSILVYRIGITVDALSNVNKTACGGINVNYTYTKESSYEKNLNLLYSNLISKSSSLKFYNTTVGDASNKVYGLFQCRYDLSHDVCSECVKDATQKITQDCPSYGKATVWYYECMLRYANDNIFSVLETYYIAHIWSKTLVPNHVEFSQILATTMNMLIKNASYSSQRFASSETNLSLLEKLYSFAQCTPDLDSFDCENCLKRALSYMGRCCTSSAYTMVFFSSCQLRYDSTGPFLKDHSSPASNTGVDEGSKKSSMQPAFIGVIIACVLVGLFLLSIIVWICCRCCNIAGGTVSDALLPTSLDDDPRLKGKSGSLGDTGFERYDFDTLRIATRDFSAKVILSEGGFGIVYKGTLENGDHLAIKRLSKDDSCGQGTKEFMAEARLLVKLQHVNLVKLVGFCSAGDEKLLVYEFMSNASLDRFLFDPNKQLHLDWATRNKILVGIARGLKYLHTDSRHTIIHCDLKPGNILLNEEMNPKIADFGTAKLFAAAQKFGNTHRIVGTPGYMAPEYLDLGEFSEKSDVYSFGIMLLEIVSGEKNRASHPSSFPSEKKEDLSIRTWKLWKGKRSFEIIDSGLLINNCSEKEVVRCIQIGLLCLQEDAEQRPTMGAVVVMLTGSVDLPLPSIPMRYNMPTNNIDIELSSDVDRTSTKSNSTRDDVEEDLFPIPSKFDSRN